MNVLSNTCKGSRLHLINYINSRAGGTCFKIFKATTRRHHQIKITLVFNVECTKHENPFNFVARINELKCIHRVMADF